MENSVKQRVINDVEVLGEWDHGMSDPTLDEDGNVVKENPTTLSPKKALQRVEQTVERAIRGVFQRGLRKIELRNDEKERLEEHTEEEVMGMKLCVKKMVHEESFEAPC